MMRITTSDSYWHGYECPLGDCQRHYCNDHRLLFRDCDTAIQGTEGDSDVIGGIRVIWESQGECPECVQDYRVKRFLEQRQSEGVIR